MKGHTNLTIEIHEEERADAIRLSGLVDISESAELKQALMAGLGRGGLRLAIASGAVLDVTSVQLLWAAGSQARSHHLCFELAEPLSAELCRQMAADGFDVEQIFACSQAEAKDRSSSEDPAEAGDFVAAASAPEPEILPRPQKSPAKRSGGKAPAQTGKRVR